MIVELCGGESIDLSHGGRLTAIINSEAMSDDGLQRRIPIRIDEVWNLEATYSNRGDQTAILSKGDQRIRVPAYALRSAFNWDGKHTPSQGERDE